MSKTPLECPWSVYRKVTGDWKHREAAIAEIEGTTAYDDDGGMSSFAIVNADTGEAELVFLKKYREVTERALVPWSESDKHTWAKDEP